ncbi:MAG TPA: hypothetical protein VM287_04400 [Egibacteraceae bacterium]|nr:hypothetical protein [Egibacteraceae bacterium]
MGEKYVVNTAGLEGRQVMLEPRPMRRPVLWMDGQPAEPGAKRGEYLLRTNDARTVTAVVRPRLLGFDPVPDMEVDGERVELAERLPARTLVWAGLPLGLVFLGGALGGLTGGLATTWNVKLLRKRRGMPGYLLTGLVTIGALTAWLLMAGSLFTILGIDP